MVSSNNRGLNRRPPSVSAGDLTGRTKQRLSIEQNASREREEQEENRRSMQEAADDAANVFDPRTEERLSTFRPSETLDEVGGEEPLDGDERRPAPRFGVPREEVFTGQERDEEETPQPVMAPRHRPAGVVRNQKVRIRVTETIEKMTYGMRNGEPDNYNFKEGRLYEVPVELADHLAERGLVHSYGDVRGA